MKVKKASGNLGKSVASETFAKAVADLRRQLELGRFYQRLFGFSLAANEAVGDFDKLLDLILLEIIHEQKLAETGSIFLVNEDRTKVRLHRKEGLHSNFVQYTEFDVGQGIAGIVAKTGEPILINECSRDPRYLSFRSGIPQLASILGVPMVVKDEILGVICIHNSTRAGGFTENDQFCLTELAKIAAIAVNNAASYNSAILESLTDPATKLLNRRGIEASLEQHIRGTKNKKQPLSILFIDIDGLKHLNDTYGYDVGDQTIMSVAHSIKTQTFARDVGGKWKEGDEFLVILPGANSQTAAVVAERMRARVEATRLPRCPDESLTISIGVATLQPRMQSGQGLVKAAENAKNRAKLGGKNKVCLATVSKTK